MQIVQNTSEVDLGVVFVRRSGVLCFLREERVFIRSVGTMRLASYTPLLRSF